MRHAEGYNGVVASGHPDVSRAGVEVLEMGGNAVDAAVASAFVSFHAEPLLTSPAGAGFAVAVVDGRPISTDFFATAPGLGMSEAPRRPQDGSFFGVDVDFGSATQTFHIGAGSVAVPCAAPGLLALHERAGRLPRSEVLGPALRACQQGTAHTPMSAVAVKLLAPIVASTPSMQATFLDATGRPLPIGATYRNPDLEHLVHACIAQGSEVFAQGPMHEAILATSAHCGGLLTAEDLRSYRIGEGAPVRARCADAELLLAAPPSAGGMWVGYAMALLDGFPKPRFASADHVLLLQAAFDVAEAERVAVVGDQTPSRAHAWSMLQADAVRSGRRRVRELVQQRERLVTTRTDNEHGSTTHVSVVDGQGNACAITVSNGESSGVVVDGTGIFLNNFLGEDDINPLGFHRFAPGARMGSAMVPLIARRPDGTVLAIGSGGSNRIRTAVTQVVRGVLTHGLGLMESVDADRVHVRPESLLFEAAGTLGHLAGGFAKKTGAAVFSSHNMYFGGTHAVLRHPDGRCEGVGDARRSGVAMAADVR